MNKQERLKWAYDFLKTEKVISKQEDVAQAMKASRANVTNALNGKEHALTDKFLTRFSHAFPQISLEWLLYEKPPMLTVTHEFGTENTPQILEGEKDKDVIEEQRKITERIMLLVTETGEIPKTFALKCNIEISLFMKKLKGQAAWSVADIHKICDTYRVRKGWLVDGEGQMARVPDEILDTIPVQPSKYTITEIEEFIEAAEEKPHIPSEVMAGGTTGISEAVAIGHCEMKPVVKMLPNYDYTITIKGDSMEPKFESGDIIAIKKVSDVIEWGQPYVLDTHDGAVLKRLYEEGNKFRCASYNSEFPDFLIDKDIVEAVYRVVGLVRI